MDKDLIALVISQIIEDVDNDDLDRLNTLISQIDDVTLNEYLE